MPSEGRQPHTTARDIKEHMKTTIRLLWVNATRRWPHLVHREVYWQGISREASRPGAGGVRAGGPSGECCMSPLHGGGAPYLWECFRGLISSITRCSWHLDWAAGPAAGGSGLGPRA